MTRNHAPVQQSRRTALPLAGVNVVDFGQFIAGPAVAMILGDLGATVVRVEHPDGPLWDNPANATLNRNKLIVPLDLTTTDGLDSALSLIEEADVVIENFRPGKLARLGIDFRALREARPELVTLSLPGFASDDELRRDWKAFESIIAAASGVFTDMGLNRMLMGVNPSFSPLPLSSAYATVIAAASVSIALYARTQSGRGEHIEVPLASAVMEGLTYNSLNIEGYPERYKTQREIEIERRHEQNLPMNVSYDYLQELLDPFFRNYLCSDGRMFYVVCPSHRFHAKRCLQTLGIYDELVAEGLNEEEDVFLPVSEWRSDASLGSYPLPKQWADRIAERMKEVFLTRPADEWERIFGEGRFPGAAQRWLEEWIDDTHVHEASLTVTVEDEILGEMVQPGPFAWLTSSAEEMLTPAPRRWGNATEALQVLRSTARPELPAMSDSPSEPWLSGIRILDLCNVIAGPHSAGFLTRFGAEVIKIDPASPLYDPWNSVVYGITHMRGKQSVLLDMRTPEGREVLEDLIKSVDVVVWNATDRQVIDMGLDDETLRTINPEVLSCQLDCFGGVRTGPRSNYLGYDDLVQAVSGIMLRFGGSAQTPEEHAHVGTIDVMCGFAAALGMGASLFQREVTGKTDRARTSLSALTGLAQIPFFYKFDGRGPFDEPSGPEVTGYGPVDRQYRTASGESIMLASLYSDVTELTAVEGLGWIADVPHAALEDILEATFLTEDAATWESRFTEASLGGVVCTSIRRLRDWYTREADGAPGTRLGSSFAFSHFPDHPSGHGVTQLDPLAVRLTDREVLAPAPSEKYGASTAQVLENLGYEPERVARLREAGVISDSWSGEYLPS